MTESVLGGDDEKILLGEYSPSPSQLDCLDDLRDVVVMCRDIPFGNFGYVATDSASHDWAIRSIIEVLKADGSEPIVVGSSDAEETFNNTLSFLNMGVKAQPGSAILDFTLFDYENPVTQTLVHRTVGLLVQGRSRLSNAAHITAIIAPEKHLYLFQDPIDTYSCRSFMLHLETSSE